MFKRIKNRINTTTKSHKTVIVCSGGVIIGAGAAIAYVNYKCQGMSIDDGKFLFLIPKDFVEELRDLQMSESQLLSCLDPSEINSVWPEAVS